jgi:hypothetical protein
MLSHFRESQQLRKGQQASLQHCGMLGEFKMEKPTFSNSKLVSGPVKRLPISGAAAAAYPRLCTCST